MKIRNKSQSVAGNFSDKEGRKRVRQQADTAKQREDALRVKEFRAVLQWMREQVRAANKHEETLRTKETLQAKERYQEDLRTFWVLVRMMAQTNLHKLESLRYQGLDCHQHHLRAVANLSSLLQAQGKYLTPP
ncbi:hypothetical protein [Yersinia mollaretii]|uniref:hypothetical protein n=1 Tax=Yersinia mollaretii TaxID=33060 RepID=UPI0011A5D016|nr:hypothetical protein [Yersinia mollaretii]